MPRSRSFCLTRLVIYFFQGNYSFCRIFTSKAGGHTILSLTLTNVKEDYAGTYKCEATINGELVTKEFSVETFCKYSNITDIKIFIIGLLLVMGDSWTRAVQCSQFLIPGKT